jgi:hypothetical protein
MSDAMNPGAIAFTWVFRTVQKLDYGFKFCELTMKRQRVHINIPACIFPSNCFREANDPSLGSTVISLASIASKTNNWRYVNNSSLHSNINKHLIANNNKYDRVICEQSFFMSEQGKQYPKWNKQLLLRNCRSLCRPKPLMVMLMN